MRAQTAARCSDSLHTWRVVRASSGKRRVTSPGEGSSQLQGSGSRAYSSLMAKTSWQNDAHDNFLQSEGVGHEGVPVLHLPRPEEPSEDAGARPEKSAVRRGDDGGIRCAGRGGGV